jgi:hypothetical protein
MSAYIVDKNHIVYLVQAAMQNAGGHASYGPMHWYFGNPTQHDAIPSGDYIKAAEVANMLWRENIASVSYRYPEDKTSATLPGPVDREEITERDFILGRIIRPVQVLKSCQCFDYQSCEHPGWKASEARAFIEALKARAINSLPGYEEAEWGAPVAPRVLGKVVA